MFEWLNSEGQELKSHTPGAPNYLTGLRERRQNNAQPGGVSRRPFPLNTHFVSESILSEELRNEIHRLIMVEKKSVREVSIELGVDMRRIGAVVRLVELEKQWKNQGKPLALPYARAVHEMVPVTYLKKNRTTEQPQQPHESINDLPAHRLTEAQIFYPVSESRQFNRVDAGRVFSGALSLTHGKARYISENPTEAMMQTVENPQRIEKVGKGHEEQRVLQPAEVRIPHPQLVAHFRDQIELPNEQDEWGRRFHERLQRDVDVREEKKRYAEDRKAARTTTVDSNSSRYEFRFTDVVVSEQTTGADGRGAAAPGRRYGVPNYDRSKGRVKIPKRVSV